MGPTPQHQGGIEMHENTDEQHHADDPQRPGVRQHGFADLTQVLGVTIEGRLARERLEVAVHVGHQVQHHDQPGDCHRGLVGHGRAHRCPAPLMPDR